MLAALLLAALVSGPAMHVPRVNHTATLLPDGRVFIAGGHGTDARCEIYDPATNSFRVVGSTSLPRLIPAATLLADGRVLITAGFAGGDPRGLPFGSYGDRTADLFDPKSETFSRAGDLNHFRYGHTSTLLPDGRVLVAGGGYGYISGFSYSLHPHRGTELYDPASNTFTVGPLMETPRWEHTSTLLRDGTVLLAGLPNDYEPGVAGELFDGATLREAWSGAEPARKHTATLLHDGRVFLAGMRGLHLFDPATGAFSPIGRPQVWNTHAATLLFDGRVLLTGGDDSDAVEIFDPVTSQLARVARLSGRRSGHTATRLHDGRVLIAGGRPSRFEPTRLATTELYAGPAPSGKRRAARK